MRSISGANLSAGKDPDVLGIKGDQLFVLRHKGNQNTLPRISVGRFVVVRESWRVDVAGQPFTRRAGEFASYRAVDRWRRSLGLPDRVYVKLSGEVKPFYVDFGSPVSVLSFLAVLRGSLTRPKGSTELTLSEALPAPAQAWTVDGEGGTYVGEVRMTVLADRVRRPSRPD